MDSDVKIRVTVHCILFILLLSTTDQQLHTSCRGWSWGLHRFKKNQSTKKSCVSHADHVLEAHNICCEVPQGSCFWSYVILTTHAVTSHQHAWSIMTHNWMSLLNQMMLLRYYLSFSRNKLMNNIFFFKLNKSRELVSPGKKEWNAYWLLIVFFVNIASFSVRVSSYHLTVIYCTCIQLLPAHYYLLVSLSLTQKP